MGSPRVAEVIVETGGANLQKVLDYEIPVSAQGKIQPGSRVLVPLGNRKVTGFVVGTREHSEGSGELKPVSKLMDEEPVFTGEQLQVARWVSSYYLCPPQRALQAIAYPGLHKTASPRRKRLYLNFPAENLNLIKEKLSRAPKQAAVLETVAANPGVSKRLSLEIAGVTSSVVDTLVKKGLLYAAEEILERDPAPDVKPSSQLPELTGEQKVALDEIDLSLRENVYRVFLLHGVTGSGKTEVYLRGIERALQLGKTALVLIPEISLTPQMIKVFKERLGKKVALLHSRMSRGERYDQWKRIYRGEAGVVLGVRSAVFAPLQNPGLIIVDEEHEFSYKQEETPRYHARAVALYRGYINRAAVVLGSATPSLESYCRALDRGPYKLLEMNRRVDNIPMPRVEVVDMREEFQSGNKAIISMPLFRSINLRLENKEQVILFLNRRGFNTFVVCRECGLVLKCPNCDISLTYHHRGDLRCHYCNYSQMAPSLCPGCHSRQVGYFGTGTQKVEQEVAGLFPGARVVRMDADTTGRKEAPRRILDSFEAGEADILIGTQMIAKGLNLPGVTLVGVISADTGLYIPDFRASERTFQLITQVAGRSGRSGNTGEVIIQTFNPEHYAVTAAAEGDYNGFFQQEMKVRREMQYPPYSRMARLIFYGRDEDKVNRLAETVFASIKSYLGEGSEIHAVGPAPAPLTRVRGNYRLHVVLWSSNEDILREAVKKVSVEVREKESGKAARCTVDIDPYGMM